MGKMTESNLRAAFAGESQAHVRYLIFADKAQKEGYSNVARLFRAFSFAEQIHATNHLKDLKGIGSTSENLQAAVDGERFEMEEMYPAYKAVAELQGEKGAVRSITWAMKAEEVHFELYDQAKTAVADGNDAYTAEVHVCEVCGWTGTGEKPGKCPLCGASANRIRTF